MAGKTLTLTPREFYKMVVIPYGNADRCLIWPYARTKSGYAVMWQAAKPSSGTKARMEYVHRMVCAAENGPKSGYYDAAHSCGRGRDGCVNPLHLSWKSRVENEADKLEHGTHNRGARHGISILTDEDVRQIRTLRGYLPQSEIGQMFGVSRVAICQIHTRLRWGWLD